MKNNIQELKDFINSLHNDKRYNSNAHNPKFKFYKENKDKFDDIMELTSFLNDDVSYTERYYCVLNDITEYPICQNENCNNIITRFYGINKNTRNGYGQFCSNKCSCEVQRSKKTEESYKKASKSIKQTILRQTNGKYTNASQIPENIQKIKKYRNTIGNDGLTNAKRDSIKSENTKLQKYGMTGNVNPKLTKQTMLERYGVENAFQTEYAKQRSKESQTLKLRNEKRNYYERCIKEYSTLPVSIITSFKDFSFNDNVVTFRCDKCFLEFERSIKTNGKHHHCPSCYVPKRNVTQTQIFDFIKSQTNEHVLIDDRTILKPKEIDIYIPNLHFGIEYNGLKWHSFGKSKHSKFNNYEFEQFRKYSHLDKTVQCEEKGIQLYHVFEDEWLDKNKQLIWKSMILSKMNKTTRVYARKCKVKEIETKEARDFFEINHLQGYVNAKVKIGLYYEDELISSMTFSKSRYNKKVEWELIRFATKINITVVGGASKMLKYFERNYKPTSLISYANRRWSQGNVYERLGFEFVMNTSPNYFYFKENELILESRQKFQKHKLKDILKHYDENLSETENMYNNDYRKIYDVGNKVYIKEYV